MKINSLKERTYEILESLKEDDRTSRLFELFIVFLIFLNVLLLILESIETFAEQHLIFLALFSVFSLFVFSIEYLLRLWSCTVNPSYKNPVFGRLKWALTPYALIDLIVILPFYLLVFFGVDLTGLVILRVFRLFKIIRYSESINTIIRVVKAEKDTLITTYFVLFIVLIVAATMMYQFENAAQPEVFSNIPDAMWWGVITLTTVGYGDIYPVTIGGRFFGAIIALIGIGIFALPAGILASGFSRHQEEFDKKKDEDEVYLCPHCKKEIMKNDLWHKK
ncbi:ion transporter [Methanoplanus sp. FWC-SCC4]|uniref:Ion transporter n=1 Tax=Methanochimaera problematica TaxID=2609417 RepID=A0AA97I4J6_9EURY|nr:ion transporter [Methanoplanus sp. FWC-SCC4]WOF17006.1 ion transporter [Methanoplanus sp. FWC-SCC4]